ncbi:DUF2783 domain-containing protein [Hwanghaeella grinnelliae]|uniref:DUF2783 domain-containing protein n=2 Tax=Hwanghaeella grinnelliae TaxID=2500179 RepID=A0A3S2W3S1_9PROT|nr:DUF2783 domain-containing protein [Hwanghaeella grinnelliae]
MPGKSRLITEPNIPDPDGFYERLIAAHRNLDDEQSAALNSRLILLLANHIGDQAVLIEAIDEAANG